MPRPTLILRLQAPNLPAESWEITDATMGIGRLDNADIPIPDKSVSRQHARILPTPNGFEIEDLGSVNGTWLNDRQITDRTPLSNGDHLLIGDVPVSVELRHAAAPPPPPPPPPSVSAPRQSVPSPSSGPSTVFYDIDEALAVAQPSTPPPSRLDVEEVPTALDVEPVSSAPPPPPQPQRPIIIDTPVRSGPVDQPTLIAGEVAEPPPPTVVPPRPAPPPPPEQITPARRPSDFVPAFEPRPPTPPPEVIPPRDVTPPRIEPRPQVIEPRPQVIEPKPAPPPETEPTPDLSATALIDLADQLAAALRQFKGDAGLALWLFEHAGGEEAAHAFTDQLRRVQRNPSDQRELEALMRMTPTASSLLEAATMLARVVSTLGTHTPTNDEPQANASNLQPISRP